MRPTTGSPKPLTISLFSDEQTQTPWSRGRVHTTDSACEKRRHRSLAEIVKPSDRSTGDIVPATGTLQRPNPHSEKQDAGNPHGASELCLRRFSDQPGSADNECAQKCEVGSVGPPRTALKREPDPPIAWTLTLTVLDANAEGDRSAFGIASRIVAVKAGASTLVEHDHVETAVGEYVPSIVPHQGKLRIADRLLCGAEEPARKNQQTQQYCASCS
jgi:hypothetical protein